MARKRRLMGLRKVWCRLVGHHFLTYMKASAGMFGGLVYYFDTRCKCCGRREEELYDWNV